MSKMTDTIDFQSLIDYEAIKQSYGHATKWVIASYENRGIEEEWDRPKRIAKCLANLRNFIRVSLAETIGVAFLELYLRDNWEVAMGLEGADRLIRTRHNGDIESVADLLFSRISENLYNQHIAASAAIVALQAAAAEPIALLTNEYEEVARILIKNWFFVRRIVAAPLQFVEGDMGGEIDWGELKKLLG